MLPVVGSFPLVDCPTQLILHLYLSVVFHDKYERTQQGNLLVSQPMILSNSRLHSTTTKSPTYSEFNDALLGVTEFPATENTLLDLELAACTGKPTLLFKLFLAAINKCTSDKPTFISIYFYVCA